LSRNSRRSSVFHAAILGRRAALGGVLMWLFVILAVVLVVVVAYVSIRDRHHPYHGPMKGDDRGWGNDWPR
jgi:hypothetical protein